MNNNDESESNTETPLQEYVSNEIMERNINIVNETIEKQISSINDVDTSTNMKTIEKKEQDGTKTNDDVDIYNNSIKSNGNSPFKNSKKYLNDSFNDSEIQRFISEHNSYTNITIKKIWSKWSSWSQCSRTCGDGIKLQSRECMLKM